MMQFDFGWLREPVHYMGNGFEVTPLDSFEARVNAVKKMPTYGARHIGMPTAYDVSEGTHGPASRFELPTTHHATFTRQRAEDFPSYFTAVLGFVRGIRLLPAGFGHLHRVYHGLPMFSSTQAETVHVMEAAIEYWDREGSAAASRLFASIHWLQTADAYALQYERLAWLYTAFDSVHVAAFQNPKYRARCGDLKQRNVSHKKRLEAFEACYGTPVPAQFDRIVKIRNDLVHEARLDGRPLGYSATAEAHELAHELSYFVQQIIFGLLGVECGFRAVPYCWQRVALDIVGTAP